MSRKKWTMKKLKLRKRKTFLKNQSCPYTPKPRRLEMILSITLLNRKRLKRVVPICSSKPKEFIRTSHKKKLILKTIPMRSQEYVLIILIVSSKMTYWRRNSMTLLPSLKTEKRKFMTLSSKLRKDIMLLIKNSLELINSIEFGLN